MVASLCLSLGTFYTFGNGLCDFGSAAMSGICRFVFRIPCVCGLEGWTSKERQVLRCGVCHTHLPIALCSPFGAARILR